MPSTAQLPQLINVFGMQGRLGEVSETNHLCDEQGIPRICFGLTDIEAADGVGLRRVVVCVVVAKKEVPQCTTT